MRLKELQNQIQEKDKQFIKLQKLNTESHISKEYDEQLYLNKQYYENQMFLVKNDNDKLLGKVKYVQSKVKNLDDLNTELSVRIRDL